MIKKKNKGNGDGLDVGESNDSFSSLLDNLSGQDESVVKDVLDFSKDIMKQSSNSGRMIIEEMMRILKPHIDEYRPEHVSQAKVAEAKIRSETEKHKAELEYRAKIREHELKAMQARVDLLFKLFEKKLRLIDKAKTDPKKKMELGEKLRRERLKANTDSMRNIFGFIGKSKKQLAKIMTDMEVENQLRKLEEEETRYLDSVMRILRNEIMREDPLELGLSKRKLLEILDEDEE